MNGDSEGDTREMDGPSEEEDEVVEEEEFEKVDDAVIVKIVGKCSDGKGYWGSLS